MPTFSFIIPSFNQDKYIRETLQNLTDLKKEAASKNIAVQLILADNCSDSNTLSIIDDFKDEIDNLFIEKDKGQYDAINKGLAVVAGDYWTWVNTDDLIDKEGFFKIAETIANNPDIDYIYGNVGYIDENSKFYKTYNSGHFTINSLVNTDASISQPGSFFKTSFTQKIGSLAAFQFAFDYEYILRCLKNNARVKKLECTVAFFRYYTTSKSGSKDYRFLKEQMVISKQYGRNLLSKLTFMLTIRILKRRFFNV